MQKNRHPRKRVTLDLGITQQDVEDAAFKWTQTPTVKLPSGNYRRSRFRIEHGHKIIRETTITPTGDSRTLVYREKVRTNADHENKK
jgi:hypothetical protein